MKTCTTCLMCVLFSGAALAAEPFPPAWGVGDTWSVHVKEFQPSSEGRVEPALDPDPENPEPTEQPFTLRTKKYQISGVEDVDGRPAFRISIIVQETGERFSIRVDQEKRYVIDYVATSSTGAVQQGVNRVAPRDSIFGSIPGSRKYLLDFVVFPMPNANETRMIASPGAVELEGYSQTLQFLSDKAVITATKSTESGLTAVHEMTWKVGDKWPETAVRRVPSSSGGLQESIVETLVR